MKVRMIRDTIVNGHVAAKGEIVEVPENQVQILLYTKKAEKVKGPAGPAAEKAVKEPRERTEDPRRPPRR